MSMKAAIAFLKSLSDDAALRQKVLPAGEVDDSAFADVVSAAANAGHEFSASELKEVLGHINDYLAREKEDGELSEEQLEKAAGGVLLSGGTTSSYRQIGDLLGTSFDYQSMDSLLLFGRKK